jgi:endonuclease YncB( thermonuclease family)
MRGGEESMGLVKTRLLVIFAAVAAASAAGRTIHRSFRGGLPSAVSEARQNAAEKGASIGVTRISPRTKIEAFKKIVGRVTSVIDGDTIWVVDAAGKHKVGLAKIDAPKREQPFGKEAMQFLSDLVDGKEVEVHWAEKDRNGRLLGIVYLKHEKGNVEVNLTMVKNGFARHRSSLNTRTPAYAEAEKDARKFRRGIWAVEGTINP